MAAVMQRAGPSPAHSVAMAETLSKPNGLMQRYCGLAKQHNIWLSLGGFQTKLSDAKTTTTTTTVTGGDADAKERIGNTHVIVNSSGAIVSTYLKIHLFDVNIINGPSLCEVSCALQLQL